MIANETAISNVEGKHGAGGLEYRGYQIEDLAAGVSYLEAAYLLLHGDLPKRVRTSTRSRPGSRRPSEALPRPW